MKLLHQCLVLGAIASLATSCSQEAPWSGSTGEEGRISLKLKTDLSVTTSTRANDSESPVKPDGERFAIKLESTDGSYVKEWENLNKFNDEEGFPRGNYTVTASYGSPEEQGFTKPYYVGTEQITVVPGETSSHSVTATLANSMVSIRYSDSFISYFSQYSASLVADGIATPVVFARNETRPAYVKSGEVTVNFNISNQEGQQITVAPASFMALPRRHYIVTATVNESEQQGVMALQVQFDDEVVGETVEILLTDDLFSSPAPEVTSYGFEDEATIETFEGVNVESKPEFHVVAFGGIKEAKFYVELINDNGILPAFNSEADLTSDDPTVCQLIAQSNLKYYGFANKEASQNNMAVVSMKDFIETLAPGEYKFSMKVTDNLGRIGESTYLIAKINGVEYTVIAECAPKFMSKEISMIVSTNYAGAKDEFTFLIEDESSDMQPAKIISVEEVEINGAEHPYCFRYVIEGVANIADTDWFVTPCYAGREDKKMKIDVDMPGYEVEVDPYATSVILKITPTEDVKDLNVLVESARININGANITDASQILRDAENGYITVFGLTQGINNNLVVSYGSSEGHVKELDFMTEEAISVPNGDFEDLVETINTTINQGGEWTITAAGKAHQTTLTMMVSEPRGWHSSNSQTCNTGAKTVNSWFVIPSVYNTSLQWNVHQPEAKAIGIGQSSYNSTPSIYKDDYVKAPSKKNAMVIRNVAWDHNGEVPKIKKQTGNTDFSNYYCDNKPNSISNRTAGSLILGEGNENGVVFTSRPSTLKGQYMYLCDEQDKAEKGLIVINLLSGSKVIATGRKELDGTDSKYHSFDCPLEYVSDVFGHKATSLQIFIYSSNKETDIKTTDYCNKDECCSRGASLFVDALEFDY